MHKHRLQENNIPVGLYYSKEFFKDTTTYDVTAAIEDIHIDFEKIQANINFMMPIQNYQKPLLMHQQVIGIYALIKVRQSKTSKRQLKMEEKIYLCML